MMMMINRYILDQDGLTLHDGYLSVIKRKRHTINTDVFGGCLHGMFTSDSVSTGIQTVALGVVHNCQHFLNSTESTNS